MYIYGLSDPADGVIRYVGFTKQRIERRLIEHVAEAKAKSHTHKQKWIRKVISDGRIPEVIEIEAVTQDTWQDRERFWIAHFSENRLVNSTDGGEGLVNPAQDVRDRISVRVSAILIDNSYRTGIKHTTESKKAISDGLRNSQKHKDALLSRPSRVGIPMPEETKRKISATKTGVKREKFSDEWIENMRKVSTGRLHTEETKAKMSAWQIGRKLSGVTASRIGKAMQGRVYVNDGVTERLLKLNESMPDGWTAGRKLRIKH